MATFNYIVMNVTVKVYTLTLFTILCWLQDLIPIKFNKKAPSRIMFYEGKFC